MTHTLLLLGEKTLVELVVELRRILRNMNVIVILSLTTWTDQSRINTLGSMADGIIKMRLKEGYNDKSFRRIRVRHLKGVYFDPKWTSFHISNNGSLIFKNTQRSSLKTPQSSRVLYMPNQF